MSFTSATAHLPNGDHVAYMDSGPVKGSSTYTTIVIVHGTAFNSHVFDPLHALAGRHNLRVIAIQRKDYTGTSEYTDAELDDLRNGDRKFLDHLTIFLGLFIRNIIQVHNLPKPNAQRSEGGVTLVGWSMGCATALTFLSDGSLFEAETYEILRRFMIKFVLYDPAPLALGIDPTKGQTIAGQVTSAPTAADHASPQRFASSYYDNPDEWDGDPNKLDPRPATDHATTDSWSEEQQGKIFEPTMVLRGEYPLVTDVMQSHIYDMLQRVLFDENVVKRTFPNVGVLYFVCWRSAKLGILTYQHMRSEFQERADKNQFTRSLSFRPVKGVNHFWHWDFPDDFLRVLADAVRDK